MSSKLGKVTVGGQSRAIALAHAATTLLKGNFQSYYSAGAFSAYTGMWGVFVPNNDQMAFTVSQRINTSLFPAMHAFSWNVTPDVRYQGLNGYLHIDYGNYDNSPGSITPQQVYALTACSLTANWTYSGDAASGLLAEIWLSSTSAASGDFSASKVYEVGFLPKMSASSLTFATGLSAVGSGSFTSGGVTWNVGQSVSGSGTTPYFVAYRADHANHQGVLPFYDLLMFLTNARAISGNEWVNGLAFGVEPLTGAGTLVTTGLSGTVTGAARVPWTISDLAASVTNSTTVQLSWTPAPGATSYQFQVNGGSWITVSGSDHAVTASGLTASTAYTFAVRGVNATGNAVASNTATVTTPAGGIANVLTNGDFSSGATGWSNFGFDGKTVSGNAAHFAGTGSFDGFNQSATFTAGKYYEVTFTVSGFASGGVRAQIVGGTGAVGTNRTANGTYVERLLATTGNTDFYMFPTAAGTTATIDNISVVGPYNTSTVGGA